MSVNFKKYDWLAPVHKYTDNLVSATKNFVRTHPNILAGYPETFKYALWSENFGIRKQFGCVWTYIF